MSDKAKIDNPYNYEAPKVSKEKMEMAIEFAEGYRKNLAELRGKALEAESTGYEEGLAKVDEYLEWAHEFKNLTHAYYVDCDTMTEGHMPLERDGEDRIYFYETWKQCNQSIKEDELDGVDTEDRGVMECWVETNGTVHCEDGVTFDPDWLLKHEFTPYQPQFEPESSGPDIG